MKLKERSWLILASVTACKAHQGSVRLTTRPDIKHECLQHVTTQNTVQQHEDGGSMLAVTTLHGVTRGVANGRTTAVSTWSRDCSYRGADVECCLSRPRVVEHTIVIHGIYIYIYIHLFIYSSLIFIHSLCSLSYDGP
jgi:hypothetical protein